MNKKKAMFQVIIAHPIPEERQRLATLFECSGMFRVCHMTHDGLDCLREAVSVQPDLIVVHAVLDKIDGLELLRRLAEFPLPKTKRVYLTNYSNFLSEQALLAKADHCILTPCPDEILVQRASELILPPQDAATDEEINAHTVSIFHAISAGDNKKGYYYGIDGVRILVRDPKLVMRRRVTTELYGTIAQMHDLSNIKQVERCLRTLTNQIFLNNSAKTLEQYFDLVDIRRSNITNTAFLSAIARHVTARLRAEKNAAQGDEA